MGMDNTSVAAGLLAKRAEIQKAINDVDRETRKQGVIAARRKQTMGERSVHFMTGELTRRCQTDMRDANDQPLTVDQVAVTAMREKHLGMGDDELRQDINWRFIWTLNRMVTGKAVVKQGWGAEARWTLP
jgi:hypothetical protein